MHACTVFPQLLQVRQFSWPGGGLSSWTWCCLLSGFSLEHHLAPGVLTASSLGVVHAWQELVGGLAVVCVWDLAPADPELTLLINPDRRCFRAWQGCWQATEACKKPPHTNWEVFKSERVFINHVHHMRVKGCCQALFLKRWEKLLANRWLSGDVVGCSIRRDCAYRVVPLPWRILLGNIKY